MYVLCAYVFYACMFCMFCMLRVYLCCLCYLCYVYFLLLPSPPYISPYISSYLYILKTPVRVGVPDVYIIGLTVCGVCVVVCVGVAAFVCDGAVWRGEWVVCVCRGG